MPTLPGELKGLLQVSPDDEPIWGCWGLDALFASGIIRWDDLGKIDLRTLKKIIWTALAKQNPETRAVYRVLNKRRLEKGQGYNYGRK